MARKGLNFIPEALVDIICLLTTDPSNSQARAELVCLMDIQSKMDNRPLEPEAIIAADFPHAYGSISNPPLRNPSDPHQMSLPFVYKASVEEEPPSTETHTGVIVSGCIACKVIKDKKDLKECRKCRSVNYCNKTCQRADWPTHKYTCRAPVGESKMMKVGRNIHHHEFFQVHLILYALRAIGPPKLRDGDHEFLLMVVIELVSISPPPPDPGKPQKRIAVTNILPVPLCIVPPEIVDLHRAVVAGKGAGEYLHSIWITKSGVYRLEEDTSRIGVLAIQPLLLQSMGNPIFTLDLYSHSYGLYRRVNFDLDFLFTSINDELRLDTANHYSLQV
ncbi:hypothetical protein B0H14DRAFT_3429339 [Mycena olivaceomarginata]|nr:hypothetical protein B0H14DRAFT_3429339 [Mycena olivaceomarginata]